MAQKKLHINESSSRRYQSNQRQHLNSHYFYRNISRQHDINTEREEQISRQQPLVISCLNGTRGGGAAIVNKPMDIQLITSVERPSGPNLSVYQNLSHQINKQSRVKKSHKGLGSNPVHSQTFYGHLTKKPIVNCYQSQYQHKIAMEQAMVHKNRKIVSKVKNSNMQSWNINQVLSRETSQELTKQFSHLKEPSVMRTKDETLNLQALQPQFGARMIDHLMA